MESELRNRIAKVVADAIVPKTFKILYPTSGVGRDRGRRRCHSIVPDEQADDDEVEDEHYVEAMELDDDLNVEAAIDVHVVDQENDDEHDDEDTDEHDDEDNDEVDDEDEGEDEERDDSEPLYGLTFALPDLSMPSMVLTKGDFFARRSTKKVSLAEFEENG